MSISIDGRTGTNPLTLDYRVAGVAKNTLIRVVGTGNKDYFSYQTSTEAGQWVKETKNGVIEIDSKDKLPKVMGVYTLNIDWSYTYDVGGTTATLQMGKSGKHVVYLNYEKPTGLGTKDELKPTMARMKIAVTVAGKGQQQAIDKKTTPTVPRIVYEICQQHVFNFYNAVWSKGDNDNPVPNEGNPNVSWLVDKYWTTDYPGSTAPKNVTKKGADCISNAVFTSNVLAIAGVPGASEYVAYAGGLTKPKAKEAVVYSKTDRFRPNTAPGGKFDEALTHLDGGGKANAFEGTLKYTFENKDYFIPFAGGRAANAPDFVFKDKDGVLSVFASYGWYNIDDLAKPVVVDEWATWPQLGAMANLD